MVCSWYINVIRSSHACFFSHSVVLSRSPVTFICWRLNEIFATSLSFCPHSSEPAVSLHSCFSRYSRRYFNVCFMCIIVSTDSLSSTRLSSTCRHHSCCLLRHWRLYLRRTRCRSTNTSWGSIPWRITDLTAPLKRLCARKLEMQQRRRHWSHPHPTLHTQTLKFVGDSDVIEADRNKTTTLSEYRIHTYRNSARYVSRFL